MGSDHRNRVQDRLLRPDAESLDQAAVDTGRRPGVSTDEQARVKALERDNKELRRANEIVRKAAVDSMGQRTKDANRTAGSTTHSATNNQGGGGKCKLETTHADFSAEGSGARILAGGALMQCTVSTSCSIPVSGCIATP